MKYPADVGWQCFGNLISRGAVNDGDRRTPKFAMVTVMNVL